MMLTFNIKKEWFEKIKSGEKRCEYREVKPYWTKIFVKEFFGVDKKKHPYEFNTYQKGMNIYLRGQKGYYNRPKICFMNGMFPEEKRPRLYAKMESIEIINGKYTDLKFDGEVYKIKFELLR